MPPIAGPAATLSTTTIARSPSACVRWMWRILAGPRSSAEPKGVRRWWLPFDVRGAPDRRSRASRKRAASPPVTARWSNVSDSGSRRRTAIAPSATTTDRAVPPGADDRHLRRHHDQRGVTAAEHAEVRERDRRAAQVLRARRCALDVGPHRVEPAAEVVGCCGRPTSRSTGTNSPSVGVDGDAEVDVDRGAARPRSRPRYQALSAGSARTARARRHAPAARSGPCRRPSSPMSASSVTVAGTTSACRAGMFAPSRGARRASGSASPARRRLGRVAEVGQRHRRRLA